MPYALLSCSFVTLLYCYCFLNEINGDGDGDGKYSNIPAFLLGALLYQNNYNRWRLDRSIADIRDNVHIHRIYIIHFTVINLLAIL